MRVFVYVEHKDGVADDSALELISAAALIAPDASVTAVVTGSGADLDAVCNEMIKSYSEVIKVDSEDLTYPNGEAVRKALISLLPADALVLIPHTTFGMDLGPGLAIKLDSPFISDVAAIDKVDGDILTAVRQEFGGQVNTHVQCSLEQGAVINVRQGAFVADESKSADGSVIDRSAETRDLSCGRRFLEVVDAEKGEVDITKEDVLVSIGRGIGKDTNIEIAQNLADAMGAALSCSRPVVDSKWLEKARQVGTSGQTVKPKVYLACGISGALQHLGGLKGNPFVIAINTNPHAPIFQIADVGVLADILSFLPELTKAIQESQ